MSKKQDITQKTLTALLSGLHPEVKKYAGRQVFVINREIVVLKKGDRGMKDFRRLKEKYGKPPVLIFVPEPGSSYILIFT